MKLQKLFTGRHGYKETALKSTDLSGKDEQSPDLFHNLEKNAESAYEMLHVIGVKDEEMKNEERSCTLPYILDSYRVSKLHIQNGLPP